MSFTAGAGTRFLLSTDSSGTISPSGPLSIAGGTAITNTPVLSATQTWNNAAVTFTGWRLNVTDTASNAASLLLDLQVGGVSQFSVSKAGRTNAGPASGSGTAYGLNSNAGAGFADWFTQPSIFHGSSFVAVWNGTSLNEYYSLIGTARLQWATGTNHSVSDLALFRDAANTLAQRNGVNWQAFRIYSTYTDASNYERLEISQSGTGWYIGNGALGTGPGNRQITLLAFGQLVFGSNGGAKWLINTTGHLLANTDNSFDIGASGANRPRNLFLAGNITTGGGLTLAAAGYLTWPGRGSFDAAAVDIVRLAGATVGAALQMSEMTAPAAPAANEVRIYAEDNGSGKTRLMARFATGAAQQIAIEP